MGRGRRNDPETPGESPAEDGASNEASMRLAVVRISCLMVSAQNARSTILLRGNRFVQRACSRNNFFRLSSFLLLTLLTQCSAPNSSSSRNTATKRKAVAERSLRRGQTNLPLRKHQTSVSQKKVAKKASKDKASPDQSSPNQNSGAESGNEEPPSKKKRVEPELDSQKVAKKANQDKASPNLSSPNQNLRPESGNQNSGSESGNGEPPKKKRAVPKAGSKVAKKASQDEASPDIGEMAETEMAAAPGNDESSDNQEGQEAKGQEAKSRKECVERFKAAYVQQEGRPLTEEEHKVAENLDFEKMKRSDSMMQAYAFAQVHHLKYGLLRQSLVRQFGGVVGEVIESGQQTFGDEKDSDEAEEEKSGGAEKKPAANQDNEDQGGGDSDEDEEAAGEEDEEAAGEETKEREVEEVEDKPPEEPIYLSGEEKEDKMPTTPQRKAISVSRVKQNKDSEEIAFEFREEFKILLTDAELLKENEVASIHEYYAKLGDIDKDTVVADTIENVLRQRLQIPRDSILLIGTEGWCNSTSRKFACLTGLPDADHHPETYESEFFLEAIALMQNVFGGVVGPLINMIRYKIARKDANDSTWVLNPTDGFQKAIANTLLPSFSPWISFGTNDRVGQAKTFSPIPSILPDYQAVRGGQMMQLNLQGITPLADFLTCPMGLSFEHFPTKSESTAEFSNMRRGTYVNQRTIKRSDVMKLTAESEEANQYHNVTVALAVTQLCRSATRLTQSNAIEGIGVVNGVERDNIIPPNMNWPLAIDTPENEGYFQLLMKHLTALLVDITNSPYPGNTRSQKLETYIPSSIGLLLGGSGKGTPKKRAQRLFKEAEHLNFAYAECKIQLSSLCREIWEDSSSEIYTFAVKLWRRLQRNSCYEILNPAATKVIAQLLHPEAEEYERNQMTLHLFHFCRLLLLRHKLCDMKVEGNHRLACTSLYLSGLEDNFPTLGKEEGELRVPLNDLFAHYTAYYLLIPVQAAHNKKFLNCIYNYSKAIQVAKANFATTKVKDLLVEVLNKFKSDPDELFGYCQPLQSKGAYCPDGTLEESMLDKLTEGRVVAADLSQHGSFFKTLKNLYQSGADPNLVKNAFDQLAKVVYLNPKTNELIFRSKHYIASRALSLAELLLTQLLCSDHEMSLRCHQALRKDLGDGLQGEGDLMRRKATVYEVIRRGLQRSLMRPGNFIYDTAKKNNSKMALDIISWVWLIGTSVYDEGSLIRLRQYINDIEIYQIGDVIFKQGIRASAYSWLSAVHITPFMEMPQFETTNNDLFFVLSALVVPANKWIEHLHKLFFSLRSRNEVFPVTSLKSLYRPVVQAEIIQVQMAVGYILLPNYCIHPDLRVQLVDSVKFLRNPIGEVPDYSSSNNSSLVFSNFDCLTESFFDLIFGIGDDAMSLLASTSKSREKMRQFKTEMTFRDRINSRDFDYRLHFVISKRGLEYYIGKIQSHINSWKSHEHVMAYLYHPAIKRNPYLPSIKTLEKLYALFGKPRDFTDCACHDLIDPDRPLTSTMKPEDLLKALISDKNRELLSLDQALVSGVKDTFTIGEAMIDCFAMKVAPKTQFGLLCPIFCLRSLEAISLGLLRRQQLHKQILPEERLKRTSRSSADIGRLITEVMFQRMDENGEPLFRSTGGGSTKVDGKSGPTLGGSPGRDPHPRKAKNAQRDKKEESEESEEESEAESEAVVDKKAKAKAKRGKAKRGKARSSKGTRKGRGKKGKAKKDEEEASEAEDEDENEETEAGEDADEDTVADDEVVADAEVVEDDAKSSSLASDANLEMDADLEIDRSEDMEWQHVISREIRKLAERRTKEGKLDKLEYVEYLRRISLYSAVMSNLASLEMAKLNVIDTRIDQMYKSDFITRMGKGDSDRGTADKKEEKVDLSDYGELFEDLGNKFDVMLQLPDIEPEDEKEKEEKKVTFEHGFLRLILSQMRTQVKRYELCCQTRQEMKFLDNDSRFLNGTWNLFGMDYSADKKTETSALLAKHHNNSFPTVHKFKEGQGIARFIIGEKNGEALESLSQEVRYAILGQDHPNQDDVVRQTNVDACYPGSVHVPKRKLPGLPCCKMPEGTLLFPEGYPDLDDGSDAARRCGLGLYYQGFSVDKDTEDIADDFMSATMLRVLRGFEASPKSKISQEARKIDFPPEPSSHCKFLVKCGERLKKAGVILRDRDAFMSGPTSFTIAAITAGWMKDPILEKFPPIQPIVYYEGTKKKPPQKKTAAKPTSNKRKSTTKTAKAASTPKSKGTKPPSKTKASPRGKSQGKKKPKSTAKAKSSDNKSAKKPARKARRYIGQDEEFSSYQPSEEEESSKDSTEESDNESDQASVSKPAGASSVFKPVRPFLRAKRRKPESPESEAGKQFAAKLREHFGKENVTEEKGLGKSSDDSSTSEDSAEKSESEDDQDDESDN